MYADPRECESSGRPEEEVSALPLVLVPGVPMKPLLFLAYTSNHASRPIPTRPGGDETEPPLVGALPRHCYLSYSRPKTVLLFVCTFVYTHIYMYTYISYVHISTNIYMYIHVQIHVCIFSNIYKDNYRGINTRIDREVVLIENGGCATGEGHRLGTPSAPRSFPECSCGPLV